MGLHGKDKHPRDLKRRENKVSQRAKQKEKESYKGIKKYNFKKKVIEKVDCCICFSSVDNTSDNSVKCGKTVHFICGECKFRCNETGNDKCPMCRSHPIKNPVAREFDLITYTRYSGWTMKKPRFDKDLGGRHTKAMTPKQRRNYCRNYSPTFWPNSNRIVRERKGWTSRSGNGWISDSRVIHYNGFNYDTDSDSSSDTSSDTVSTLTLVDWQDDEVDSDLDELSEYMDMIITAHN